MNKQKRKATYLELFERIDWENYTKKSKSTEKIRFWGLPEVLYCKLDYVLECEELDDEQRDTIDLVQSLMEILKEIDLDKIFNKEHEQ